MRKKISKWQYYPIGEYQIQNYIRGYYTMVYNRVRLIKGRQLSIDKGKYFIKDYDSYGNYTEVVKYHKFYDSSDFIVK